MHLGGCLALFNFATFLVMGHLTAAGEQAGASPTRAAALISLMLGASLLTRLGTSSWTSRAGPTRVLWWSSVSSAIGLVVLAASGSNLSAIAIGGGLAGLGFGAYLPCYAVLARLMFPQAQAGRRISEIYFFGFAAGGEQLISASADGVVVRDLSVAGMRRWACRLAGRDLSAADWRRYLRDQPAPAPVCPALQRPDLGE